jgi:hypothetical protein
LPESFARLPENLEERLALRVLVVVLRLDIVPRARVLVVRLAALAWTVQTVRVRASILLDEASRDLLAAAMAPFAFGGREAAAPLALPSMIFVGALADWAAVLFRVASDSSTRPTR